MYLQAMAAALVLVTLIPVNTSGQEMGQAAPARVDGVAAGLPKADPSAAPGEQGDSKNWLMRSPLVDVGWPEIKMPKLNWNPRGSVAEGDQKSPGPIARMTQATRSAAKKGRVAWNNTVDKMKVGPFRSSGQESKPGFFAKMFGGEEQPQRAETVAEFVGQDRPKLR